MRRNQPGMALKVSLKLAVQRLRSSTAKKEAQNKVARREIASLLEKGKEETARVRVESIIAEEITIELQEVLELYCELCIARIGLIEQSREVDESVREAVSGLLYASPKTDLKELHTVTNLLLQHYGRDYVLRCMDNVDNCVPARVTSKLNTKTPETSLIDQYLAVIAESYGINWKVEGDELDSPDGEVTMMDDLSLAERESINSIPEAPPIDPKDSDTTVAIHTNLSSPKAGRPASLASKSSSTQVPQTSSRTTQAATSPTTAPNAAPPAPKASAKSKADADFDALQKRFEALKKR